MTIYNSMTTDKMAGLTNCKSRKQKFCRSFKIDLLVCTALFFNSVKCEEHLPILNYCCPGGSKYDFDNERCTDLPVTSTNVESSDTEAEIDTGDYNGTDDTANQTYYFSSVNGSVSDFPSSKYITLLKQVKADHSSMNQTAFRFRLDHHFPTTACTNGNFIAVLQLREDVNTETTNLNPSNSTKGSPPIQFTSKGQLKIDNEYYSTPEFCIAEFKKEVIIVRVCNATCSEETPCIRKCCDLNEAWNLQHKNPGVRQVCIPTGENTWEPELYKYPTVKATPEERRAIYPHYKIMHPREFCKGLVTQSIEQKHDAHVYWKFRISTKGKLFRRTSRYTWTDDPDESKYCLDGAVNSAFLIGKNQTEYSGLRQDEFLFRCFQRSKPANRDQSALYAAFMILSCFFLLLTIIVHVAIFDKQPNRVWTLTLLSYSTSLFFFHLVFATMHISGFIIRRDNKINYYCYTIGVAVHFFFISTFCWMSAVNYDIYHTFKALKPAAGKSKGLRKYLIYAAFALTVPTVIVTVGIVVDNVYRYDFESGIIIPEYGKRRCNLDPEYAQLAYTYGPAGVLLVFNIICFLITIYKMHIIKKSTKFATASSSKKNKQKQSLTLFAKLLFVMGFPWIFEIISWYMEKDKDGNSWYWVGADLLNICQAIAIFWIFVCKPDVFKHLEEKYPWFQRLLDRVTLDTETAQKITERHPKLKRVVKLITRKSKRTKTTMTSSTEKGGSQTNSTAASESSPDKAEYGACEMKME